MDWAPSPSSSAAMPPPPLNRAPSHPPHALGSPSSIAAQCSPSNASSRSPSPLPSHNPLPNHDSADRTSFPAGASDRELREQASRLRISLSPPLDVHIPSPSAASPSEIARLGPDPSEPRPVVKGAAAGEGEQGGVARGSVEPEPENEGGEGKSEEGPAPGTGGKYDHCGSHEGIGVGMPKGGGPKAAKQKNDSSDHGSADSGKASGSGSGSGRGSGSGSGAGYGADASASADSSATPQVGGEKNQRNSGSTGEDPSRSRSMAPEPEVSPQKNRSKKSEEEEKGEPTARRPRKQPPRDEEGGNMLPPSGKGEHYPLPPSSGGNSGIRGAGGSNNNDDPAAGQADSVVPPSSSNAKGGRRYHHHRHQDIKQAEREGSSAGNELDERFGRPPSVANAHLNAPQPGASTSTGAVAASGGGSSSQQRRARMLQNPASFGDGASAREEKREDVEMRDAKTGAYVTVARAPGRKPFGHQAPGAHGKDGRQWGNVGEQSREAPNEEEMMDAMRADVAAAAATAKEEEARKRAASGKGGEVFRVVKEEDVPQRVRGKAGSESNEDTSGTEGWFRTLNYHYRPPPQPAKAKAESPVEGDGNGDRHVKEESEDQEGDEAQRRKSPRALLGRHRSSPGEDSGAGALSDEDAQRARALATAAALRRLAADARPNRRGAGGRAEGDSWGQGWSELPDHVRRVLIAQQLGRMNAGATAEGVPGQAEEGGDEGEEGDGGVTEGREGQIEEITTQAAEALGVMMPDDGAEEGGDVGDGRNLMRRRSSGRGRGRGREPSSSAAMRNSASMGSGAVGGMLGLGEEDEDATFREIVDDLTVQNKVLKSRLRRYEPAKQPKGIKKERLFEVRFFEGMPPDRRRELEGFLTAFVQSLHDPAAYAEESATRSISRSMPSVSAIHNSTGDERMISSGGEASDPREPVGGGVNSAGSSIPSPNRAGAGGGAPVPQHDSGYGSRASGSGQSAHLQKQQLAAPSTANGSHQTRSAPSQTTQTRPPSTSGAAADHNTAAKREKPRLSEQDRLAAPSFSGFEPPSATGTGTGMKISPPHEASMDWQPNSSKRKRNEFEEHHGTDTGTTEKAKAVAAAVEKLFRDSAALPGAGGPTSGDIDPMPLPDQAGTNQAYLRNLIEASGTQGWIYLNLAFGMAQLHRFHVAMPFVLDAIRSYAPSVEVSADGRKLRRNLQTTANEGEVTSDGQGTGSSVNLSSVHNDTSTSQAPSTGHEATSTRPTADSTAQTSLEPSKAGSKSHTAGKERTGDGSVDSSVPIIRGPDYRLVTERKEEPAVKRLKTSHIAPGAPTSKSNKSTSAYVPLFNHGADSDSAEESSPFYTTSMDYSEDPSDLSARRIGGEGTLSFFAGGRFYSDMSAENTDAIERIGSREAEGYTVGLEQKDGHPLQVPSEVKQYDHTFLRRPGPAFERAIEKIGPVDPSSFDGEADVLPFEVGHMDETERTTIELEALVATGMTNLNISDNFSLIVTLAYLRAHGASPDRRRKYLAMDMSPAADLEKLVRAKGLGAAASRGGHHFTYRPVYERPISHLPSSRQRLLSHAYALGSDASEDEDDASSDSNESQASPGSGDELSPPEIDEPPYQRYSRSPHGDYNMSLQYPFMWSRSAGWNQQSSSASRPEPSASDEDDPAASGGVRRRRSRGIHDDHAGPSAKRRRIRGNSSALATPSSAEAERLEYTPMDFDLDAYVSN